VHHIVESLMPQDFFLVREEVIRKGDNL